MNSRHVCVSSMLAPTQRDCLFGPQVSATSEFPVVEFAGAEEMEVAMVAMVVIVAMVATVSMVAMVGVVAMVDKENKKTSQHIQRSDRDGSFRCLDK